MIENTIEIANKVISLFLSSRTKMKVSNISNPRLSKVSGSSALSVFSGFTSSSKSCNPRCNTAYPFSSSATDLKYRKKSSMYLTPVRFGISDCNFSSTALTTISDKILEVSGPIGKPTDCLSRVFLICLSRSSPGEYHEYVQVFLLQAWYAMPKQCHVYRLNDKTLRCPLLNRI